MEQQLESAAATSSSSQTILTVANVTADTIDVDYQTMPGNQPNTYGNFLAIWQNTDSIPWNSEPLKTFPIPTNTQAGSATFGDLNITSNSYIIGYAVGSTLSGAAQKYGNVCSTAYIPASGSSENADTFASSVENIKAGSTSASFDFVLPDGVTPKTNGAWAGLWRGAAPNLYGTAPLASVLLSPDVSSGRTAFNNVSIGRGTAYTIAIFMSGYQSTGGSTQKALACSAGFTG